MVTVKRDLRTGRPVWLARPAPRLPVQTLAADLKTDVLVIGAGISGALIAEALTAQGRQVAILDRRGPARGSTPASTALVEYEIDTPLTQLARQIGDEPAARAWQRSHLALTALVERTRALGMSCGLTRRDNLYLAGNVLDAAGLEAEVAARRAIGLETTFLTAAEVKERYGVARRAALLAFGDAALDPVRLTVGYLKTALDRGARLYAPAEVTEVSTSRGGITVATKDGPTLHAEATVFATGYEVPKLVPPDGHRIVSTFAIATRPQPGALWPTQCHIWEASEPYLYLRTTPTGRVICGGEDVDTDDEEERDALIPAKVKAIRRKLSRLLPQLDTEPDFAWAGFFGASDTGLPSIGAIPGHPNCFAALGFGGNGITYARLGADIIAAALDGRTDPDADLYAFSRTRALR